MDSGILDALGKAALLVDKHKGQLRVTRYAWQYLNKRHEKLNLSRLAKASIFDSDLCSSE